MDRFALGILSLALLAALTATAGTPPNLDKTLAAQQELVASQPYDAGAYNDLGNLLVLGGRYQEAQDAYRRAIELEPTNTLARFNLGVLLQQIGRPREALAEYRSLLDIDERHARANYQLGMLYESRDRRNAALEHYARAFAFDPELTFAHVNPHIIDNRLATEAILMSRRFLDSPSSSVPRLYGEPERIAELMLKEKEVSAPVMEVKAEPGTEPPSGESAGRSPYDPGDEAEAKYEDDEDEDDEEDSEDEGESRRTLTREDLIVGSSVGQARQSGASAHSPKRGPGGGRAGSPVTTPDGRDRSVRTPQPVTGRPPAASGPRYRPASRFSTGRLELKLLPPEPSQEAAT